MAWIATLSLFLSPYNLDKHFACLHAVSEGAHRTPDPSHDACNENDHACYHGTAKGSCCLLAPSVSFCVIVWSSLPMSKNERHIQHSLLKSQRQFQCPNQPLCLSCRYLILPSLFKPEQSERNVKTTSVIFGHVFPAHQKRVHAPWFLSEWTAAYHWHLTVITDT